MTYRKQAKIDLCQKRRTNAYELQYLHYLSINPARAFCPMAVALSQSPIGIRMHCGTR